jgi:hypothetical protein
VPLPPGDRPLTGVRVLDLTPLLAGAICPPKASPAGLLTEARFLEFLADEGIEARRGGAHILPIRRPGCLLYSEGPVAPRCHVAPVRPARRTPPPGTSCLQTAGGRAGRCRRNRDSAAVLQDRACRDRWRDGPYRAISNGAPRFLRNGNMSFYEHKPMRGCAGLADIGQATRAVRRREEPWR